MTKNDAVERAIDALEICIINLGVKDGDALCRAKQSIRELKALQTSRPDADRLATDRAIDAIDLALRDSRCAFGILKTGKPDDACDHLLHKNCEKALTSLDYIRAAIKSGDKGRDELQRQISSLEGLLNLIADALDRGETIPAIVPRLRTAPITEADIEWAKSIIQKPPTSEGV